MSNELKKMTAKDGESKDLIAENVDKLKQLFPEIVTEGKIDFDTLKEVLGDFSDDRPERYSFTWNGKTEARKLAMTPSKGTLRPAPEESVNWDTTQNLFIEGDNLEVLKLLQRSYHKKIKMIYIDPPYNTGKDFVYKDNFKDNLSNYLKLTGQKDGEGNKITSNPETSGRYHTDWLNMMYPRLKLARELLREDGVIFISIDENEHSNLIKLCNEIFGEENFLGNLIWKRRSSSALAENNFSIDHEYVIAFSGTSFENFRGIDKDFKNYTNPDNDPRGPWTTGDLTVGMTASMRPNQAYNLVDPKTGKEYPFNPSRVWAYIPESMDKLIQEDKIIFPDDTSKRPMLKRFKSDLKSQTNPFSSIMIDRVGLNTEATKDIQNLFGVNVFEYSKPMSLLDNLTDQVLQDGDYVLDFFAGSGATATSTLKRRASKSSNVNFIMIQLPEKTSKGSEAYKEGYSNVAEIGKERIRRYINKLEEKYPTVENLGFKVFKLDASNIKPWDPTFEDVQLSLEDSIENIKSDRSEEDVIYEILLKYGLDLALPIEEKTIAGAKVYVGGAGALILCLSDNITTEVVEGVAKLKDELNPEFMRVVFRDSGFKDDVIKTNAVQILKQQGIEDMRSI